jgi:methanogenic corrinoid protein MtbC1
MWPLSEKFGFEVETKETPLLKIIVVMSKVMPTIGVQELEAAFEQRIMNAANLLVRNYNITKHNTYKGHQHGHLNRVFELAGVLCRPRPEPNVHNGRN